MAEATEDAGPSIDTGGLAADLAMEEALRDAMSPARIANREMTNLGTVILREEKTLNLPLGGADLAIIAAGESLPLVKSRNEFSFTGHVCAPIAEVPAVCGQAGWQFIRYGQRGR